MRRFFSKRSAMNPLIFRVCQQYDEPVCEAALQLCACFERYEQKLTSLVCAHYLRHNARKEMPFFG